MRGDAADIFDGAGLAWSHGFQPPGWHAAGAAQGVRRRRLSWVASGRDLRSPIRPDAKLAEGLGLVGASLMYPERTAEGLVHFSSNFQATTEPERAFRILDEGGVLAVKAHATKYVPGHIHHDGVDRLYMNYLDRLFCDMEDRCGDAVDWTTMGRIAESLGPPGVPPTAG